MMQDTLTKKVSLLIMHHFFFAQLSMTMTPAKQNGFSYFHLDFSFWGMNSTTMTNVLDTCG